MVIATQAPPGPCRLCRNGLLPTRSCACPSTLPCQAASAVEQRRADAAAALREAQAAAAAGAALDGKAAPAADKPGERHEALRLALLKYKVQGLLPGSAVQQLCFERLLGQAPALEVRRAAHGGQCSGRRGSTC